MDAKVGDRVICNGFPGTVTQLCEWSRNGNSCMVEVRLASGVVCVDQVELKPDAWDGRQLIRTDFLGNRWASS